MESPPLPLPPLPVPNTKKYHSRYVLLPPILQKQKKVMKRLIIRYTPSQKSSRMISKIIERAASDPLIRVQQGSDSTYGYISLEGNAKDIREVLGTEESGLHSANEETMRQSRRTILPNIEDDLNQYRVDRTKTRKKKVENSLLKATLKRSFEKALQQNRSPRVKSSGILPTRLDL